MPEWQRMSSFRCQMYQKSDIPQAGQISHKFPKLRIDNDLRQIDCEIGLDGTNLANYLPQPQPTIGRNTVPKKE